MAGTARATRDPEKRPQLIHSPAGDTGDKDGLCCWGKGVKSCLSCPQNKIKIKSLTCKTKESLHCSSCAGFFGKAEFGEVQPGRAGLGVGMSWVYSDSSSSREGHNNRSTQAVLGKIELCVYSNTAFCTETLPPHPPGPG